MDNNESTINERLKILIKFTPCRSINAFSKRVGISQRSMSDYVNGVCAPKTNVILKIIEEFPEFNKEWLMFGNGEMFNPKYVTNTKPNYSNVATSNSGEVTQTVTTTNNDKYVQELENSRASILKLVLRKIGKALECSTKEESDARLKELEEDLNELGL